MKTNKNQTPKTVEQLNRALWAACMGNMSMAAGWLIQAKSAVQQDQCLASFMSQAHYSNRRKAKAAYDLAVAESIVVSA